MSGTRRYPWKRLQALSKVLGRPTMLSRPRDFYVVEVARVMEDEWTIEGIFSKEEDAQQMVDELNCMDWVHPGSALIQILSMEEIMNMLGRCRLAALAEIIPFPPKKFLHMHQPEARLK